MLTEKGWAMSMQTASRWLRRWAGVCLSCLLASTFASAEEPDPSTPEQPPKAAEAAEPGSGDPEPVALDRLLQLPESYGVEGGEPPSGGASASDWRARFADADEELALARRSLADAQRELEATAGDSSQWQISAPGVRADAENSGTGLANRQRVRRYREEVEEAERRRRALEIEADLAGVPAPWRE
jgi:hypothetical protein